MNFRSHRAFDAPGGAGAGNREWLRELVGDLDDDGIVETAERDGEVVARLG